MVDVAAAFSFCRLPRGNRVAVITGSGGSAVWMADILSAHGLELPVLEEDIQKRAPGAAALLRLGAEPGRRHGAGDPRGRLRPLVEIVRESKRIDMILLIGSLANEATRRSAPRSSPRSPARPSSRSCCRPTRPRRPGAMARFAEAGIPCYTSMPSCARAIRALVDYGRIPGAARRPPNRRHRRRACATRSRRALAAAGPVLTEKRPRHCSPVTAFRARRRRWPRAPTRRAAAAARSAARSRSRCSRRTSCTRPKPAPWRSGQRRRRRARGLRAGAGQRQGGAPGRRDRRRAGAGDGAARASRSSSASPATRFRSDADGRDGRHPCRGAARRGLRPVPIGREGRSNCSAS